MKCRREVRTKIINEKMPPCSVQIYNAIIATDMPIFINSNKFILINLPQKELLIFSA
jgi:hypothetical protein